MTNILYNYKLDIIFNIYHLYFHYFSFLLEMLTKNQSHRKNHGAEK